MFVRRAILVALNAVVLLVGAPCVAQEPPPDRRERLPQAPSGEPEPERPEPAPPVLRLPGLKVTGTRLPSTPLPASSVPGAVDVMSGPELRETYPTTLQEGLRRLPGATTTDQQGNPFQMDLSLRGFQVTPVTGAPQGISVFVDGVRVNEPTVEEVNFDLLPLDDIERIELIRGPGAVFGRNTLGGVINIVTRRRADVREIVPEAEWGSFGYQKYRLRVGGVEGPADFYLSGTFLSADGWRDATASRIGRVFARAGVRSGATDIAVSYQRAQNRIEQAGSLPESELGHHRARNFSRGDFFEPLMNMVTLNARHDLDEHWGVALTAFGRTLDVEQFNVNLIGPNARSFSSTATLGGTVEATWQATLFGHSSRLVAGVEYAYADARVRVFEETVEGERSLESDVRDTIQSAAAWAQETLEVGRNLLVSGDALVLTAGARFDLVHHAIGDRSPDADRPRSGGDHTFSRTTPRLGFDYNPTPAVTIYFQFAEGFRAPAFLELTCASPATVCPGLQAGVAPDPALKPVKARNYEVGVRARPWPWLDTGLSLYRTDVTDDIFSVAPTGTVGLFFQNVGDTRRQGVEAALRARLGRFEPWINYAYTEATFRDQVLLGTSRATPDCATPPCTQLVRKGSELPLVPRHRVNAGLDTRLTDWLMLSLSGAYVGRQWLRGDEANVERPLGDYVVLNAALTANVKALTAFVAVQNLLDTRYETFGTFAPDPRVEGAPIQRFLTPAPPINVKAGLSWRF